MASIDNQFSLQPLEVLKGVTEVNRDEVGRGAYGRVYAVKYCQTICAAKEIHAILLDGVGQVEMQRTIKSFIKECRQCSTLRHPNVIQFLGIYYPGEGSRMRLPVMVMEMMADSLTLFVFKHEKIPIHIKYSIVRDVSLGLCYLHNHDPPIVHRDLSPNNILLTTHYVAKISDLGVAKVIKADSTKTMTKVPGTVDFMPPESVANRPIYGPEMDVFSFAGIILHTFNQQWPRPTESIQFDPTTRKMVALSEVERRQQYLSKMTGEAEALKRLVEECLDYDPTVRPTTTTICERIQVSMDACMTECSRTHITLYQENEQLRTEVVEQTSKIDQLRKENEQKLLTIEQQQVMIKKLCSTRSMSTQKVTFKEESVSKLEREALPLMPALTSGRYHIKWTQLADLPVPLHDAYVAVHDNKVYVAGGISLDKDAMNQVYVYETTTDQWSQLPPLDHYYGIPHIINGKVSIIGGYQSATKKRTNKVSTFDQDSQTWMSYYPDLLLARSKPGVTSHLEHVIVAGGTRSKDEDDNTLVVQDDVEVLDWMENLCWRKVSIKLPVPMYGFRPIISDDHLLIVGYYNKNIACVNGAFKIPLVNITAFIDQQKNDTPAEWVQMTATDCWYTALVPSSSPPVIIGGKNHRDKGGEPTVDIKMYNKSNKSWKTIGSLSTARCSAVVATVSSNAFLVIGGYTKGGTSTNAKSSSLTLVELGQAKLLD